VGETRRGALLGSLQGSGNQFGKEISEETELDSAFTASAESSSHTARGRQRALPGGARVLACGKRGRGSTPAARLGLAAAGGGEEKARLGRTLGRARGGEPGLRAEREKGEVLLFFHFFVLFQKPFEIHLKIFLNHFEF